MIVPARVYRPLIKFNPVPIDGLSIEGPPDLINLKATERIVDINKEDKVIKFYVILTDNKREYTIEVPYYLYLALGRSEIVTCKRYRLKSIDRVYNCIEVFNLDKPVLYFKEKVDKPLAGDNLYLPENYTNVKRSKYNITRVLNEITPGIICGSVTTNQLDDGIYMRAPVHIEDLLSGAPINICHRELEVMDTVYRVDIMGVCL